MRLAYLKLRPAKTEEISPEAQVGLLGSLMHIGKRSLIDRLLWQTPKIVSLELWSVEQKTHFYMVVPQELKGYFSSQILSHYPKTLIEETTDPAGAVTRISSITVGIIKQAAFYGLPIKTYKQQPEGSLLASVIGVLAKIPPEEAAGVQIILRVPPQASLTRRVRSNMAYKDREGKEVRSLQSPLYERKLQAPFLESQVRILYSSESELETRSKAAEIGGAFGVFTLPEGNALTYRAVSGFSASRRLKSVIERKFSGRGSLLVLNLEELASLWHLPDMTMGHIKNVDWGKTLLSEAPENLPVAEMYPDETLRRTVNFFGKTDWRNHEAVFGIGQDDRRKHVYIIGKTGAGKSTLIANMAINDIRNGNGVALVDPHGDLSEMILNYIPKRRVNDVVYLDPTLADDRSFSLNLFDDEGAAHTDVVASGIISVFYKLYQYSWGPRLEYILRNTILTLLYTKNATFADIITLLTQADYRRQVVAKLQEVDPVIAAFWRDEFEKMNDKLRMEAISPILNKVGQFLSAQRIRHIVGSPQSTFSLEEIMDQGKILILNLSQGKLGEDTTALLGAIFITKMQLTAMRRVNLPEDKRRDFYLYVDEFQNFATQSFIKILSESRKYRLNLIMANQYIEQVDEDIQKAVFGNVGTLVNFVVGARDATLLAKEFGNKFTEEELVSLGKYEILLKMSINGLTSDPFFAVTLPLPKVINENKDKIIRVSLERYYRKI
jgi:energy-coupling factor transporter ATP-binding protein EcfA2